MKTKAYLKIWEIDTNCEYTLEHTDNFNHEQMTLEQFEALKNEYKPRNYRSGKFDFAMYSYELIKDVIDEDDEVIESEILSDFYSDHSYAH